MVIPVIMISSGVSFGSFMGLGMMIRTQDVWWPPVTVLFLFLMIIKTFKRKVRKDKLKYKKLTWNSSYCNFFFSVQTYVLFMILISLKNWRLTLIQFIEILILIQLIFKDTPFIFINFISGWTLLAYWGPHASQHSHVLLFRPSRYLFYLVWGYELLRGMLFAIWANLG